jgi:hypothetical protein
VDTGSREENASNKELDPGSDSIGTEKALASCGFAGNAIGRLVGRRLMALKFAQRCVANAAERHVAVHMRRSSRKFLRRDPNGKKDPRRCVAWYCPLN